MFTKLCATILVVSAMAVFAEARGHVRHLQREGPPLGRPGGRGPPHGGRGGGGGPDGCDTQMMRIFGEPPFETKDCSGSGAPTCATREGPGEFVCRTLNNPLVASDSVQVTKCINPEEAVADDTCGCCGECPEPCPCACTLFDGTDGVLVQPNRPVDEANGPEMAQGGGRSPCVPAANAMSMVASERATCVATCPDDNNF